MDKSPVCLCYTHFMKSNASIPGDVFIVSYSESTMKVHTVSLRFLKNPKNVSTVWRRLFLVFQIYGKQYSVSTRLKRMSLIQTQLIMDEGRHH